MQIQDTSSLTKKIRGQNDPSWQVFSDCCQSVLPATIEKPYVELSNHFFDYFYSSLKLMESGYRLDTNVTGMNDLRNSVDELSTSERHVLESFRILFDYYKNEKNLSSEIWKTFQEMVNSGVEISSERESKETSLKIDMRKHTDDSIDASKQQGQIKDSIVCMQKDLNTIKDLDMDGQKRIDRVEVAQKHFDSIDGIPNLTSEQKEMLKEMLVSYVDLRVESFKVMEDLSEKAIESYLHRELLDVFSPDDKNYDKYRVATSGLDGLSTSFFEDSARIMNPISYGMSSDNLRANMSVRDVTTDYLKFGVVDEKRLPLSTRIMNNGLNDAYLALANTREVRKKRMER